MSALYRRVLLPPVALATRRDAEVAMDLHLRAMKALQADRRVLAALGRRHEGGGTELAQELLDGLRFPHPFGVAAGYDKNAAVYPAFEAHFSPGFVEVGTVTLRPQSGNPRPRIHRLPGGHLVNAMGFPNAGADAAVANLEALPRPVVPLGVNVGRLKATPAAAAPAEYAEVVRRFAGLGERAPAYYVVNVSSPNTPGLRALQEVGRLGEILDAVTGVLDAHPGVAPRPRRRLLVKLAPELTPDDVEAVVGLVLRYDTGGLVLTNTRASGDRPGGVSGPDLFALSSSMVTTAAALLPADRVIVATGGIDTVERAYEVLAHADLAGVYTGLVFRGPGLLRELRDGVAARMRADGVPSLAALRAEHRPVAA
ncbi:MAG TPA: dihydroorotate dehydrogenase (quinone), partial [Kineosporiaceae bacterium]|nr:dihydroorotate dehydrogenase (quinone) [Kineosporiaceae bacterium]